MSNPLRLFGENRLDAFLEGEAVQLLARRNPNLGALLGSERAVYYVQILYRLLLFRRDHELEPLHEDIQLAVKAPLELQAARRNGGESYDLDAFNVDMNQLLAWRLVERRLEKERIRGYKDNRRTRFRYRLSEETLAFLEWLEERLRSDLEERTVDARDLLEEVRGALGELLRLLKEARSGEEAQSPTGMGEDLARRILFQVHKADQVTRDINSALTDFNALLLAFLAQEYSLADLRHLLESLEGYVEKYLIQVSALRESLLPSLERASKPKYRDVLARAFEVMESQRKTAPRLLAGGSGVRASPLLLLAGLQAFYREDGTLDGLCGRINASALRVWQKMSSHLKELERKSHRLEDLRDRIAEMAALDPEAVPRAFLNRLLSYGSMRGDLHEWDEEVRATPPLPRRSTWKGRPDPSLRLSPKRMGAGAAQSLEEARMVELRDWLEAKVMAGASGPGGARRVSEGDFDEPEDFPRILSLAKAGLLGRGRNLARIGYRLSPNPGPRAQVRMGHTALTFPEFEVRRGDGG